MSAVDQGLDAAVQRVRAARQEHSPVGIAWCSCGQEFSLNVQRESHIAEAIARAAREDVPALTQQARADAWDEGVSTTLDHAVRNDNGITLRLDKRNPYRAATIREGREP